MWGSHRAGCGAAVGRTWVPGGLPALVLPLLQQPLQPPALGVGGGLGGTRRYTPRWDGVGQSRGAASPPQPPSATPSTHPPPPPHLRLRLRAAAAGGPGGVAACWRQRLKVTRARGCSGGGMGGSRGLTAAPEGRHGGAGRKQRQRGRKRLPGGAAPPVGAAGELSPTLESRAAAGGPPFGGSQPHGGGPQPRGGGLAPPPSPPQLTVGLESLRLAPKSSTGGEGLSCRLGGGPGGGSRGPVGGWGGSSPPHIGPQASLPGPSGRLGAGGRPPAPPAPPPHAPPGGAGHGGGVSRPKVGDAGSAPPRAAQPLPVPLEAGGDGGPGPLPSGSQPPPAIPAPPQQQAEAHVGGGDVKSRGGRLRGISRPPRQEVGGRAAVLRRRVLKMGPAGGAEMGGAGAVERETSLEP